jgi:tRNA A-37 threonylcarbamoyl transferase component Bud32
MFVGDQCDYNCYNLAIYVQLNDDLRNKSNYLNQSLIEKQKKVKYIYELNTNLTKINDENNALIISLNETLRNLTIKSDQISGLAVNLTESDKIKKKLIENLNNLTISLKKTLKEKEIYLANINELNSGLIITVLIICFFFVFFILFSICFFLILITFCSIFILVYLKFKKYKKSLDFEKKLLGGVRNKNINLENFIEITEDDFKIPLKDIRGLEDIGQGGSAIVFKGIYNKEIVAIKMFKQSLFETNNEDFKKELKLISKLKNTNIVNFIGFIVEKSNIGIVLEYCEFGTLQKFIEGNKDKLKWRLKLKLLLDISKGMEYIHFKKLIHRDLKLENILITKDFVAKISDFGISRVLNEKSNTKTMRVGTALYIAPEVILTNTYDQKCDIFSFAIMMFQVLTLKIDNIYGEKNKNENENNFENIELRVANDPNFRPNFPKIYTDLKKYNEFIILMRKCWDFDPKERPGFNEITMTLQEIYDNYKYT